MIGWKQFKNIQIFKSLTLMKNAVLEGESAFNRIARTFGSMAVPNTSTDTATLTVAQMLGGLLVATPTAAAAYTVPTGTVLRAAMPADLKPGDYFDLPIINAGGTGDDITMTAAADITFVGEIILRPGADAGTEHGGQGTWRFRYVSGVTFVGYRIG